MRLWTSIIDWLFLLPYRLRLRRPVPVTDQRIVAGRAIVGEVLTGRITVSRSGALWIWGDVALSDTPSPRVMCHGRLVISGSIG